MAELWRHTFILLTKRPKRMLSVVQRMPRCDNLWLGVTAENQQTADKRIPILLQIPAAVRFVSVEPMLGVVDPFSATTEVEQMGLTEDEALTVMENRMSDFTDEVIGNFEEIERAERKSADERVAITQAMVAAQTRAQLGGPGVPGFTGVTSGFETGSTELKII